MVELYLNFLCKITLVMSTYIQTRIILKEKLFLYNATRNYRPLGFIDSSITRLESYAKDILQYISICTMKDFMLAI